jgi:hypothetical protein
MPPTVECGLVNYYSIYKLGTHSIIDFLSLSLTINIRFYTSSKALNSVIIFLIIATIIVEE